MTTVMDYAKRIREPALVLVLVLVVLATMTAGLRLALLMSDGSPLATAAVAAISSAPDVVWYILAFGLGLSCSLAEPRSPRLSGLMTAGAVVLWLGVVVSLVLAVSALSGLSENPPAADTLGAFGPLAGLVVKIACSYLMSRIRRLHPAPVTPDRSPARMDTGQQAPVWQPEDAVGRQWWRAGDAASGASGIPASPPMLSPSPPSPPPAGPPVIGRAMPPISRGWKTAAEYAAEMNADPGA